MNQYYYTVALSGKEYCLESNIYGLKRNAAALGLPVELLRAGARAGLPLLTKEILKAWKESAGQE